MNEEVIHGIPGKRVIHDGDIVSVDVGATFKGFVGDCAGTYACGEISDEARKLIEVTRQSFFEGIKFAKEGYRISDIGGAVQDYVESHGYSVVREYVGHGVGRQMHEAPEVPNYRADRMSHRANPRLVRGMTIAVEAEVILQAKPDVQDASANDLGRSFQLTALSPPTMKTPSISPTARQRSLRWQMIFGFKPHRLWRNLLWQKTM